MDASAPQGSQLLALQYAVQEATEQVARETLRAVAKEPDYMSLWGPETGMRKAHAARLRAERTLKTAKESLQSHLGGV
tara:strand:+ start:59 stop:292 length:234 start_codon:yes stop_codon:yes gene_type:complete